MGWVGEGGLWLLMGAEEGECKLLQGPGDAHWEELAGCGSGQHVPVGETTTQRVCQNRPEASRFWLDKAYVNQGGYTETAGFTSV